MLDMIAKSAILGIIFMCYCKSPEPTPDGKGFRIERNYKCDPNDENPSVIICPNLSGQEALEAADEFEETYIKRNNGGNACTRAMIEKCIELLRKKGGKGPVSEG